MSEQTHGGSEISGDGESIGVDKFIADTGAFNNISRVSIL